MKLDCRKEINLQAAVARRKFAPSADEWLKTQTWSAAGEAGWFYSSNCVLPRGTFVKSFGQHGWGKVRGWRPRFIGPSILKPSPLSVRRPNEFSRTAAGNVCSECVIYCWENCCLRFIFKMKFTYALCQQLRPLDKTQAFGAKLLRATHTCRKKKKRRSVKVSSPIPLPPPLFWETAAVRRKQVSSAAASLHDLGAPCIIHTLRSLINPPRRPLSRWLKRRSQRRLPQPAALSDPPPLHPDKAAVGQKHWRAPGERVSAQISQQATGKCSCDSAAVPQFRACVLPSARPSFWRLLQRTVEPSTISWLCCSVTAVQPCKFSSYIWIFGIFYNW